MEFAGPSLILDTSGQGNHQRIPPSSTSIAVGGAVALGDATRRTTNLENQQQPSKVSAGLDAESDDVPQDDRSEAQHGANSDPSSAYEVWSRSVTQQFLKHGCYHDRFGLPKARATTATNLYFEFYNFFVKIPSHRRQKQLVMY